MSWLITILSVILIASTSAVAQPLPKFRVMTEEWVPYQYYGGSELQGISVDLMVEMLKRTGSAQTREDIQMLPWARAYQALENEKNTILFSMIRSPERENLFRWVGPIFKNTTYLIASRNRNIKISSSTDLQNYEFGTIRDDASEMFLLRLGLNRDQFTRHNNTLSNVKMLKAGRIDLIVSGWEAFTSDAYSINLDPDDFEKVYMVDSSDVSIAFHKNTADWIIHKFQKILDEIKAEGLYDKIFREYRAFEKDN